MDGLAQQQLQLTWLVASVGRAVRYAIVFHEECELVVDVTTRGIFDCSQSLDGRWGLTQRDGVNGLLVNPNNITDISNKINKMVFSDKSLEYGENGFSRLRSHFHIKKQVEEFLKIIN